MIVGNGILASSFKRSEYNWDDVLEAANYYKFERGEVNNEYMTNSSNFIKKDTTILTKITKMTTKGVTA